MSDLPSDFDSLWNICNKNSFKLISYSYKWIEVYRNADKLNQLGGNNVHGPIEVKWNVFYDTNYHHEIVVKKLPLTPGESKNLGTYDKCVDSYIEAVIKEDKKVFQVETRIWNGDMVHGERTSLRCLVYTDLFTINNEMRNTILSHINAESRRLYEEEKRKKKQDRIAAIFQSIIQGK